MTLTKQKTPVPATIESLSHDGRGVTRIDGKTVFISGALAGESITFHYTRKKTSFDEGVVDTVITHSPDRVTPPCPHFSICGGCSLQHLSADAQRRHKQSALAEQFMHQANTQPQEWQPAITGPAIGYRSKARLGVKFVHGKDKVLVGFREKNSRYIAHLNECAVLDPRVGKALEAISHALYQLSVRDKIAQIEVAMDKNTCALILRNLKPLTDRDLEICQQLGRDHSFRMYLQPKGIDSIHLIYPSTDPELLEYTLGSTGLTLAFHPSQFTQINTVINEQLIHKAMTLLSLNENDRVLDLFCGIGNFSLPIAQQVKQVVGVDADDSAIAQAQRNAAQNGIRNTSFFSDQLFAPPFHAPWSQSQYDKLVIDPPRSGALEVVSHIESFNPDKIVYISCNPATLARDTKILIDKGYRLITAGIADMFPHTQHIESIAAFSKGD